MPKLSVVIITLNEEKNIGRCLESLKDLADEIVLVDSYSNDKTVEIALSYGARIIQHPFENFVKQKNFADTQAKYDHILSLDADEVLSEDLYHSIKEVKETWNFDGYTLDRITNYCGKWIKHCGWYPDQKIRLYDRRKASWKGMRIHESLELSPEALHSTLKGVLFHYSYNSISEHIRQADRFTSFTALDAFEKGKKISYFGLWLKPKFKFFRDFILKRGFLDGYYGYVVCKISAHATFLKCTKIRELHKNSLRLK
ncbi:MAG: glycosyltransferase family 2 protein [Bacteroidales bacterium]|nr:glycosyltransferase family 2 protein [Bacteroidales bacterium]